VSLWLMTEAKSRSCRFVRRARLHPHFLEVSCGFAYRAEAGGITTPAYHVRVLQRPELKKITVALKYPEYTGWKPALEHDCTGNVKALAGTRAGLCVETSLPLASAFLVFEDGGRLPMIVDGSSASADFFVEKRASYELMLESQGGVPNAPGMRYTVEALPTCRPESRSRLPPGT